MSRIGRKPVIVPGGIKVAVSGQKVKVTGPKGELDFDVPAGVSAVFDEAENKVVVDRENDERAVRALHGMTRAMIANMVEGVEKGFEKRLHVYGTGYGCDLKGNQVHLNCGFMGRGSKTKAQFILDVPKGVEVQIEVAAARGDNDPAKMIIRGCCKQAVGQFAAEIRRIRPPEPYKGKGIRYHDEVIRRKAGKALAGG